jgi:glyoxylase-like metal-dependent hydrolase (beta-lactamase superfamily II)
MSPTSSAPVPGADAAGLPAAPEVVQLEVGLLQNFCEILYCPDTREAAVVDPAWEVDRLLREAAALKVRLGTILVTHTHHDHIEGVAELAAKVAESPGGGGGVTVIVSPREAAAFAGQPLTLRPPVDRGDIPIGRRGVRALDTPGHTVGGTCYLADGYLITGDVLFVGGCGRTDFRGGSTAELWKSLQRLMALPEETRVYPGHNYGSTPTSTVGREALENPYLLCKSFEEFRVLRERKRKA